MTIKFLCDWRYWGLGFYFSPRYLCLSLVCLTWEIFPMRRATCS
jgi:hypothetical protein